MLASLTLLGLCQFGALILVNEHGRPFCVLHALNSLVDIKIFCVPSNCTDEP